MWFYRIILGLVLVIVFFAAHVNAGVILQVTAEFADGSISGTTPDIPLRSGQRQLLLSQARQITPQALPRVFMVDGNRLLDEVSGLEHVQLNVGGSITPVDLSHARIISVRTISAISPLLAALTPESKLPAPQVMPSPAAGDIEATRPARPPTEIKFPAPVTDVVKAGDDRFLLILLGASRSLQIVDLATMRVVKVLPLASSDAIVVGGLTRFLVILPSLGVVERYSLATFVRDRVAPLKLQTPVQAAAMGSASEGPVLLHRSVPKGGILTDTFAVLDLNTLQPQTSKDFESLIFAGYYDNLVYVRASRRGAFFTTWTSADNSEAIANLNGGKFEIVPLPNSIGYVTPSPDEASVYTAGQGAFDLTGKSIALSLPAVGVNDYIGNVIPAETPGLFFNLRRDNGQDSLPPGRRPPGGVHIVGRPEVLVAQPALPEMEPRDRLVPYSDQMALDRRLIFQPAFKRLITIPEQPNEMVVRDFDSYAGLARYQNIYLFVTSVPPPVAASGTYRYPIHVLGKSKSITFQLVSGPPQMRIDQAGVLTWPISTINQPIPVKVSIATAAGFEISYEFELRSLADRAASR